MSGGNARRRRADGSGGRHASSGRRGRSPDGNTGRRMDGGDAGRNQPAGPDASDTRGRASSARDAETGREQPSRPGSDTHGRAAGGRDELRRRLEAVVVPGAGEAEQRAWAVVRSAAPVPRPNRLRRRGAFGLAAAAVVAAVAATPPGAAVGEWVRDRVDPPAERPVQPTRASRLPTDGRLLVRDERGIAVVARDGARTRVGRHDGATWSPHGRFVAAWRGARLAALTPSGDLRWQINAPAPIRAARWSLADGYRIAYVTTTGELRIVAGDGSGDRLLAHVDDGAPARRLGARQDRAAGAAGSRAARAGGARAPAAVPAWRPGDDRALALVSARGQIEVRDVDTGALLERPRTPVPRGTRTLSWSADGRRLAAAGPRAIRVYDLLEGTSKLLHARARERFTAAVYAPDGRTLARVVRADGRSSVRAGRQELFATRGRVARAAWSPDGAWLMLETPDQLVALRVVGRPRVLSLPHGRLEGWSR